MGTAFWIKRFVAAWVIAFAILLGAHWLRGHTWQDALTFGVLWGMITAVIFTVTGYIKYRRNPACMLPRQRSK